MPQTKSIKIGVWIVLVTVNDQGEIQDVLSVNNREPTAEENDIIIEAIASSAYTEVDVERCPHGLEISGSTVCEKCAEEQLVDKPKSESNGPEHPDLGGSKATPTDLPPTDTIKQARQNLPPYDGEGAGLAEQTKADAEDQKPEPIIDPAPDIYTHEVVELHPLLTPVPLFNHLILAKDSAEAKIRLANPATMAARIQQLLVQEKFLTTKVNLGIWDWATWEAWNKFCGKRNVWQLINRMPHTELLPDWILIKLELLDMGKPTTKLTGG
jgi:hypothetical protein